MSSSPDSIRPTSGNSANGTSANLLYATELTPAVEALIVERFTYKQWTPEQVESGRQVTEGAIEFAKDIVQHVPPSATRTRALNLVEEARMLANAAITHNGKF